MYITSEYVMMIYKRFNATRLINKYRYNLSSASQSVNVLLSLHSDIREMVYKNVSPQYFKINFLHKRLLPDPLISKKKQKQYCLYCFQLKHEHDKLKKNVRSQNLAKLYKACQIKKEICLQQRLYYHSSLETHFIIFDAVGNVSASSCNINN